MCCVYTDVYVSLKLSLVESDAHRFWTENFPVHFSHNLQGRKWYILMVLGFTFLIWLRILWGLRIGDVCFWTPEVLLFQPLNFCFRCIVSWSELDLSSEDTTTGDSKSPLTHWLCRTWLGSRWGDMRISVITRYSRLGPYLTPWKRSAWSRDASPEHVTSRNLESSCVLFQKI